MRVADGQLLDGRPRSVQRHRRLLGLAGAGAYLRVYGVGAGPNRVAGAAVGVDGRGAGDGPCPLRIIGRMQGHHREARADRGPVTAVRQLRGGSRGVGVEGHRRLVVAGFEGQAAGERVGLRGE